VIKKPALERLQQLVSRERLHGLSAAVSLRDVEVVLETLVCRLQGVFELVSLEDVIACSGLVGLAVLRVDGAPHSPDRTRLSFDPDDDPFLNSGVVNAVQLSFGEAASTRSCPHKAKDTIGWC
jgi:hypothetical protein